MKKLTLITLICILPLAGCTLLSKSIETGTRLNDDAITASMFTLCRGASIGSLRRNFTSVERDVLWSILGCPDKPITPILMPQEDVEYENLE